MREPTYTALTLNGTALDFTNNYNQTYGFGVPDALAAVLQVKKEFGGRKLVPIFTLLLD